MVGSARRAGYTLFILPALAAAWPIGALTGCGAPSQQQWELLFIGRDGQVRLVSVSTDALFHGREPHIEAVFETRAPCRGAWYDTASGRLATAERHDETSDVIRVYRRDGVLEAEYVVDPSSAGRVFGNPVLSPGGARVAFVGKVSAVFWTDVEDSGGGQGGDDWKRWPGAPEVRAWARAGVLVCGPCYWVGDSALAADCSEGGGPVFVWRLNTTDGTAHALSKGHVCGVIDASCIVRGTCWAPFRFWNAETGETLGACQRVHQYTGDARLSPEGEYALYFEPSLLWGNRCMVHHLQSGRRAVLKIPRVWKLGSWTEP